MSEEVKKETPKETKTVQTVTKTSTQKAAEPKIYIGPTIPGVVAKNTIFSNGITKGLQEIAEKVPAIKNLIVSFEELPEARNEMRMQDSATKICYEKVLNFMKEDK